MTSSPQGAGYPPITLKVEVSCKAPSTVTNSASATGGGDTATHTATDPTTITGACPPTLAISDRGRLAGSVRLLHAHGR